MRKQILKLMEGKASPGTGMEFSRGCILYILASICYLSGCLSYLGLVRQFLQIGLKQHSTSQNNECHRRYGHLPLIPISSHNPVSQRGPARESHLCQVSPNWKMESASLHGLPDDTNIFQHTSLVPQRVPARERLFVK